MTREDEIYAVAMIFEEEYGLNEYQAEEAAEAVVIDGYTYEAAYGKVI